MNEILVNQLAIDFCCTPEQVLCRENSFTPYSPLPGRRIFQEGEVFLKVAAFRGKLLFTGKPEIVEWAQSRYGQTSGAWFFDGKSLCDMNEGVGQFGCRVGQAHPFFIGEQKTAVDSGTFEIRRYAGEALEQFRGDSRFDEAFLFDTIPKDELGIAALENGRICGMAGATSDSERMWQIGINVMPEAWGRGIGPMLVALLKNEILSMGVLPFYGTSMSHIASQQTAIRAGFLPAWAELSCEAMPF